MTDAQKRNPLKSDPGGRSRMVDLYLFTIAALGAAFVVTRLSIELPISERVGPIDFALAVPVSIGALLAIIGACLRVLAHPHGGEMDYWGKLCGTAAACFAFIGVLLAMDTEQGGFFAAVVVGLCVFGVVAMLLSLFVLRLLAARGRRRERRT